MSLRGGNSACLPIFLESLVNLADALSESADFFDVVLAHVPPLKHVGEPRRKVAVIRNILLARASSLVRGDVLVESLMLSYSPALLGEDLTLRVSVICGLVLLDRVWVGVERTVRG